MTEWDLQEELFNLWLREPLKLNGIPYVLVCKELMFPSWQINNKYGKWNEASIDFIMYSEVAKEFLCLELKNKIRGKKDLLSAYCQVTHRTIQFIYQYTKDKIINARQACLEGFTSKFRLLDLPCNDIQISVKRVLMAIEYPNYHRENINHWNHLNYTELLKVVNSYSCQKEFKRFTNSKDSQYKKVSDNTVICLKANLKSKSFTFI